MAAVLTLAQAKQMRLCIIFRCIIPVVFYAIRKGVGASKHNGLCILFIMLATTTRFGHCGPSSGHKNL